MSHTLFRNSVCAIAVVLLLTPDSKGYANTPPVHSAVIPVRSGVITARLESDKSVYRVGEPILLRLTLINRTGQTVFYGVLPPYVLSTLEVLDAERRALSPSGGLGPRIFEGRGNSMPLVPGKPVVVEYDRSGRGDFRDVADIKDWGYVLNQPGKYTIVAHLEVEAIGASEQTFVTSPNDKSNAVHIEIK